MSHLNEGVLRRMLDEPATTGAADSAHFAQCPDCRQRAAEIKAEAAGASALLAVPDVTVEPAVALLRVRRVAGDQPAGGMARGFEALRRRRGFRPLAVGLLTLGLMGGLMATGVAEMAVGVFQPRSFAPVSVNPASLSSLPDLSQFGTYKVGEAPRFTSAKTPGAALAGSGLTAVLTPSSLPAVVKGDPVYETFTQAHGSFTFSAEKARQYAASKGKALPAMPDGIDGTTVTATAGPGVLTVYGAPQGMFSSADQGAAADAPSAAPTARSARGLRIPTLAVVQMTAPRVVSNGASVQALESYIASLPGVPADLAAQIQAIGDPASTLPVPVPTGQGSHTVDINGSQGLFVGDSTGLGAGVIWQKDGVLYAAVGTLGESDVVGVARSLR